MQTDDLYLDQPPHRSGVALMTKWLRALAPVALTVIALVVFFTGDRTVGMLLIVAALASTFLTGTSILGRPVRIFAGEADAAAVRAYRRAHPGSTISDAVRAVGEDARP
jgi:Flp pilus assembly protein TadB